MHSLDPSQREAVQRSLLWLQVSTRPLLWVVERICDVPNLASFSIQRRTISNQKRQGPLLDRKSQQPVVESTSASNSASVSSSSAAAATHLPVGSSVDIAWESPALSLCLFVRLLQINPAPPLVLAMVQQEECKYLRAMALLVVRLIGNRELIVQSLSIALRDFRTVRVQPCRVVDGGIGQDDALGVGEHHAQHRVALDELATLLFFPAQCRSDLEKVEGGVSPAVTPGQEQQQQQQGEATRKRPRTDEGNAEPHEGSLPQRREREEAELQNLLRKSKWINSGMLEAVEFIGLRFSKRMM